MSRARRRFVLGAAGLLLPLAGRAMTRTATPAQPQGPFYPDPLPSEQDADLLGIAGADRALGEPVRLGGRVLDLNGRPLAGARVEIWQVDAHGIYLHPAEGPRLAHRDGGFQGYGHTLTDGQGAYAFRTIKPVPYPGRTAHIHFRVSHRREHLLTTQLYVEGEPLNAQDFLVKRITDARQRENVIVPFATSPAGGELQASFEIVIGHTPVERVT